MTAGAYDEHRPPRQELIDRCVHCGFCLPACPTYLLWGEEMDSPRGRIVLIGEGLEPGAELSPELVGHLDNCLGCMACVTACPSGVEYDALLELARPQVERNFDRPARERAARRVVLETFTRPGLLRAVVPALALSRRLGLIALARRVPRVARLAALAPRVPARAAVARLPERIPAQGERRGTVALLQGCVQRSFFPDVNRATAEVLAAEGFEVHAPRSPSCCGALHMHTGAEPGAVARAKDTIAALERHDHVVTGAAGCGSAMKEYGRLLSDDPAWAERAAAFSARVRDVTELLAEVEPRAPRGAVPLTVAYHDACHLLHAQGVRTQPRALLAGIPGLELREVAEPGVCCGSAGIYNLVKPEPGAELGRRKAEHVRATGAQALAAANPGCLIQIAAHLEEMGAAIPTHHPVELLARSLAAGRSGSRREEVAAR